MRTWTTFASALQAAPRQSAPVLGSVEVRSELPHNLLSLAKAGMTIPAEKPDFRFIALLTVACLVLVSCGATSSVDLPSQLSRFPRSDLTNPKLNVAGIYSDGWVSENGGVSLQQPGGESVLSVRGEVPKLPGAEFHTDLTLRMDGKEVARKPGVSGAFQISAPVERGAGIRRIEILFSELQKLPGADGRMVGGHLEFIGFEPASSASARSSDILRGRGVELGKGWGPLETFKGETFRWVDNDAELILSAAKPDTVQVSVTVEGGPGIVERPFLLKLLDPAGRQLAAGPVRNRATLTYLVPVEAGSGTPVRLHVDNGGHSTPKDPRVLNYRVFGIEAMPWRDGVK